MTDDDKLEFLQDYDDGVLDEKLNGMLTKNNI